MILLAASTATSQGQAAGTVTSRGQAAGTVTSQGQAAGTITSRGQAAVSVTSQEQAAGTVTDTRPSAGDVTAGLDKAASCYERKVRLKPTLVLHWRWRTEGSDSLCRVTKLTLILMNLFRVVAVGVVCPSVNTLGRWRRQ